MPFLLPAVPMLQAAAHARCGPTRRGFHVANEAAAVARLELVGELRVAKQAGKYAAGVDDNLPVTNAHQRKGRLRRILRRGQRIGSCCG